MPTSGQRVSEYVLDQKIGAGAFGEVWRAHHHVWIDQLAAIKIPSDAQYVRNLQQEGAAVHGLVHPNIVRATGFDPYGDPPYLAMEYVPGTNLRETIAGRSVSPMQSAAILRQVLAGLGFAHRQGIVHRDIKPENVLIHERAKVDGYAAQGVVKVTDFGLGRAVNETAVGSIGYSASLNDPRRRDIAGTLDYMSPEQRTGGDIDGRADLYACGIVLYEMLTGEKPAGTDVPSDLNREVPAWMDEAFRRSYARLERRYATAEEFAAALAGPSVVPPPLPTAVATGPLAAGSGDVAMRCPRCHGAIGAGDQFCIHCGTQVVAFVRRCRRCGGFPEPADRFCIFCGEGISGSVDAQANRDASVSKA